MVSCQDLGTDLSRFGYSEGYFVFFWWTTSTLVAFLSCSFRKVAKKISELHLDTPMPPLNRTVYWLEYILRHDGAPYLRPSLYRLSFYEYYCLDILAVLFLIAGGIFFVVYRLCWRHRRLEVNPAHLNGHCLNGHVPEEKKVQ